ncbi:MAG: sigma-70 family RNA polymerase sigma factor [Bacteroidales bacterium]|nr:sigma-70 family RNA polymerase sigma factor [Bacteroidales bacterium]MDD6773090.1 sigma-70 family RNA polymerase sigma factor [Bacteroidales bacterium]
MAKIGSTPIDELVRRAIIGDGEAFTKLWDTHIETLRNYLKTSFKQLDDFYIDDICSRSFEKAFRQIGSFNPSLSQFSTWLRTIARNTALDVLDSENRNQRKLVWIDDGSAAGAAIESIGDEGATPLESIIEDEEGDKLREYIEALPELYREVARKRLIEGLQYKEIAQELDMELNTVRTRIRRAKAMIDGMKKDEDN